MNPERPAARFELDLAHSSIATAVAFAERVGTACGVLEPAYDTASQDLRLVLEELLTNVLRHALRNRSEPRGGCTVELHTAAQPALARVELHDNGPRFDPFDAVNEPGYGLALVRGLVRSYSYAFDAGGNRLAFVLPLAAAVP